MNGFDIFFSLSQDATRARRGSLYFYNRIVIYGKATGCVVVTKGIHFSKRAGMDVSLIDDRQFPFLVPDQIDGFCSLSLLVFQWESPLSVFHRRGGGGSPIR